MTQTMIETIKMHARGLSKLIPCSDLHLHQVERLL